MTTQEPRIGVYICECGINIGAVVDVAEVVRFAQTLPNVVVARQHRYTCSEAGQEMIKEDIRNLNLTRVVVASCSPRMHETVFQNAVAAAGLNPYYFQMANIREHCSWVVKDPVQATAKAKRLVGAAVARVNWHQPLQARKEEVTTAALVVGGGIAGIQAALTIAEAGYPVYLVERQPSIGGHMAQLDKTFPTLDCSTCILGPKMMDAGRHPNITLLTYSEVDEVSGHVGHFKVKVRQRPRYVDMDLCTGCGACAEACVLKKGVPNEFDAGLSRRRAAYVPMNGQAVPMKAVIDEQACLFLARGKCTQACLEACPTKAIDFEQKEQTLELEVGAIVVATGFEMFDPGRLSAFSYGKSPDIIDGLQFERLCSATGPTKGEILTSKGQKPQRVAIIHCVGSRDENANRYCSRVCCMYALKHAHLVREKTGAEVFEFYMDIRAFGKDYEEFYERVQEEGVYFVRGRGAEVIVLNDGRIQVKAENTNLGIPVRINVDMVILATAMEAPSDTPRMASIFGISRGASGFFQEAHPKLRPFHTNTEGVFLAGACQSPKDVPDTVAHAGAAASEVLALLSRGEVVISPTTAVVDEQLCSGCKTCIALCPYSAIQFHQEEGVARVNEALCKGCGTCVAACPADAITARHFSDRQIMAEIEALFADYAICNT